MKQPFCAPSEALRRVLDAAAALPRPETEIVPLDEAGGRIAAGTLSARMDQPPFDRSPFDGYALRSADAAGASRETPVTLPVTMKLYAGDAPASPLPAGCAARIMTGAPLPEGADCVLMQELTDGGVVCSFDSFLGFRHGPKAVVNGQSLLVYLLSGDPAVSRYEADLIRQISGCCRVSLGHSCATAEEANAAFDAGAGHVTHLFNAMPPMSHRAPGLPGAALDRSEVTCELICDGGHIDPIMLRNAFRLLGQDRACVISDSMRAAGLGPGTYELGGQTVYVKENGRYAVLEDGTIAASITDLFTEFKNLLRFGIDFETALRSCTINPARAIGMDDQIGSIATGKYADLLFVDEDLNVAEVYVDGIQA